MDNSVELQRMLEQERQKAMVSEMVGKLTNLCWDKCITSTPGSKFKLQRDELPHQLRPAIRGHERDHYEAFPIYALEEF